VPGLIDGVSNFLDRLQARGIKMAIGSSSPRQLVDFAVDKFGLSKWMRVIVSGSDAENGKPNPEIYLKCAALLGVEPAECLVIEDSANGIFAWVNAGMRVCAFTGMKRHDFDLNKADFELKEYTTESFNEVASLLGWQRED
jgi:HAD superfamily hydrolase (TIGR01509 family)